MLSSNGVKVNVLTKQEPAELSIERLNANLIIQRVPLPMDLTGRYETLLNLQSLLSPRILKLFRECDLLYVPGNWLTAVVLAKMYEKPVLLHSHNYALACPLSLMFDPYANRIGPCSLKGFYLHERMKRGPLKAFVSTMVQATIGRHYARLADLADAIILVSNVQYELIAKARFGLRSRFRIVPNPLPEDVEPWPLGSGVAYFGGAAMTKGYETICKAAAKLGSSGANSEPIQVFLAGDGIGAGVQRQDAVETHFMGRLNRIQARNLLKQVSVVAFTSLSPEPSSYAVMEAILSCRKLVASNVGGVTEIVRGMDGGVWLVEPGDVNQLAEAVSEALAFDDTDSLTNNRNRLLKRRSNTESFEMLSRILEDLVH